MTGPTFRAAITKLGMSLNEAGRFLRVGQATAHRWAKDGTPTAVGMLLTLMLELHLSPGLVNYLLGRADKGREI